MDYAGLALILCPEFAADVRFVSAVGLAAGQLNPGTWNAQYPTAVVLMAAHILKRAPTSPAYGDTGTLGAVNSRGARDVSEGYSLPPMQPMSTTDAMLATTWYGQELLRLRGSRAGTGPLLVRVT